MRTAARNGSPKLLRDTTLPVRRLPSMNVLDLTIISYLDRKHLEQRAA